MQYGYKTTVLQEFPGASTIDNYTSIFAIRLGTRYWGCMFVWGLNFMGPHCYVP
jgi:hypothetical protein